MATPIGNLADLGARARDTLAAVAVIACEDTRTSRTLLARHAIRTRTVALHKHNERAASAALLDALRAGKDVAIVTDAGTPGLSDPGALLVAAAHAAGVRVVPVPGASAATAALSASGFAAGPWLFAGFPPAGAAARRKALDAFDSPWPVVFFEAPHRVRATLEALAARFGAEREVVIARELTKKFEELVRLPLGEARAWLDADAQRERGEFVLVLGPRVRVPDTQAEGIRVLEVLLEALPALPAGEAARLAARITGAPRNALYAHALAHAGGARGDCG
ncbi:MAG: 16S rRNA (cytidine(1402)-2'-O)-methyltransferase [Burkholderiales bacterium]|nr:16S rRNA (cytidine(1402)-2'-O)-methyltransferase [Burkholderiales bacterium]